MRQSSGAALMDRLGNRVRGEILNGLPNRAKKLDAENLHEFADLANARPTSPEALPRWTWSGQSRLLRTLRSGNFVNNEHSPRR